MASPGALGFGAMTLTSTADGGDRQISLDQAVAIARAEGLHGDLEIQVQPRFDYRSVGRRPGSLSEDIAHIEPQCARFEDVEVSIFDARVWLAGQARCVVILDIVVF